MGGERLLENRRLFKSWMIQLRRDTEMAYRYRDGCCFSRTTERERERDRRRERGGGWGQPDHTGTLQQHKSTTLDPIHSLIRMLVAVSLTQLYIQ